MADTVTVPGPERTVDTGSDAWAGARVNAESDDLLGWDSYPGQVNPRVRRLIVTGVLVGLLVLVVVAAGWQYLVG
jgi:hypothetical protein